jgi:hypothetical protein
VLGSISSTAVSLLGLSVEVKKMERLYCGLFDSIWSAVVYSNALDGNTSSISLVPMFSLEHLHQRLQNVSQPQAGAVFGLVDEIGAPPVNPKSCRRLLDLK